MWIKGEKIREDNNMKYLSTILILFLFNNLVQAGHLDSSRHKLPVDCYIEPIKDPRQLVKESITPPRYPTGALRDGVEAVVRVIFDTNSKGEVINERALWSINTLKEINPNIVRHDKDFERAALRSIKTATYKPSKHSKEGKLSSKDQINDIIFLIEGNENTFDLGPKFSKTLRSVVDATTNQSKIPKVLESLEKILNSKELIDVQRANFLYLKAFLIYVKSPNSQEIKPLLIEMKNLIDTDLSRLESPADLPYGPNAYKLLTFSSILLGQIYINEQQWEKAIKFLEEGIHSGKKGNLLNVRFFNAHLQLGIAHYSSGNWCGAAKSWARAKIMSESRSTNYIFPDAFNVYVNYANSRLDP